jgi:hypothetical protein
MFYIDIPGGCDYDDKIREDNRSFARIQSSFLQNVSTTPYNYVIRLSYHNATE